jgi:hypothetical protein
MGDGALLGRTSLLYLEVDADLNLEENVEAAYAFWQSAAESSSSPRAAQPQKGVATEGTI